MFTERMTTADERPAYRQDSEPARLHRSGSDTRKRSQVVAVRMTPEEHAEITAFAAARGMAVGELLRAAWTYMHTVETAFQTERETHV